MFNKRSFTWLLVGWLVLFIGGFLNLSCMGRYYYDHGHRVWRDGHDDSWHKAHGDHWDDENHGDHH